MALVHSIWTVMMLLVFVGIIAWAWNGKRKASFDEAAQLALEDDHPPTASTGEPKNG
ncbi:MAG: cbb3-type cytochrome c oxidase subunit 3 [Gammaproteobacteria bacterium]|nr:cbb3-type cytochrome c oxidase subunit 3 [Gammaproteobacteria bacterium]